MLCGLCSQTLASPRSDPTTGRAVFTGAATGNATSIDLNPAAIGLGPTRAEPLQDIPDEIYVAAMGTLDRYSIDRKFLDIDTGRLSAGPSFDAYTASPGGTFAVIWHTGVDGRITLAAQVRSSPAERFLEDEALRYHTLGGYHRTISPLTVAASFRITPRFFFGVSIAGQSSYLKLRYARDTALEAARDPDRGIDSDCDGAPCGLENDIATERYAIDVGSSLFSTAILAVNLGIAARVARDVWLGFAYHAPPGLATQNELTGTMVVERAPRDGGVAINGASTVYISQPASFDLGLRARLPRLLDLHAGIRWENLARFQSYDVRGYGSTLPPAGIAEWQPRPRGFHNTWAVWAGIEQVEHSSPLVLGARLGFETSALDDERTSPLTIAPTSLTADVGVQFRVAPQLLLQLTYGLQLFQSVDVTDSAFDPRGRLSCFDSGFNYENEGCASVRNGYGIPTAAGDYSRISQAMRFAVRYEL
jgi:hypothetical protein